MSLLTSLRTRLTEARKSGKALEMGMLQVILGDAATLEGRSGKALPDEEVEKLIRKMVTNNNETLLLLQQKGRGEGTETARLQAENVYLTSLLPQTLGVDEIRASLAEVADTIRAAKNDGQATGVAMKHLKGKGLKVLGEDVSVAVKEIRSGT